MDMARFRLVARLLWVYQRSGARWLARRLGLLRVLGLGRKWNRGDDRNAGLDARLAQWRKQSDFIDRIQSDAVCYVAQKSLGSLDHTGAFDV